MVHSVLPGDPHNGIFTDLTPRVGTQASPYLWVPNRADPSGQKLSQKCKNINTECPYSSGCNDVRVNYSLILGYDVRQFSQRVFLGFFAAIDRTRRRYTHIAGIFNSNTYSLTKMWWRCLARVIRVYNFSFITHVFTISSSTLNFPNPRNTTDSAMQRLKRISSRVNHRMLSLPGSLPISGSSLSSELDESTI